MPETNQDAVYFRPVGVLRDEANGIEHELHSRHEVGRGETNHLVLRTRRASNSHGELIWDGADWVVRDLGSTNGTYVDQRLLKPGEDQLLSPGAELAFGDVRARFVLVDASPPALTATGSAGIRRASRELLALPDAEDPIVTCFRGADGQWMIELPAVTRPAVDGEEVEAGGTWRLFVPRGVPATRRDTRPRSCLEMQLEFTVSRDEEHIELALTEDGHEVCVAPRVHLALLLQLARVRSEDARSRLPEEEQGWIHREDLCGMLKLTPERLSLWIFRARRQLAQCGLQDAPQVIERRAGASQLRLAVRSVSIRQT